VCEAKVYIVKNSNEEQIMRDVVLIQPEGDVCLLVNLLGEQRLVRGHIEKIDFLRHTVYLSQAGSAMNY